MLQMASKWKVKWNRRVFKDFWKSFFFLSSRLHEIEEAKGFHLLTFFPLPLPLVTKFACKSKKTAPTVTKS